MSTFDPPNFDPDEIKYLTRDELAARYNPAPVEPNINVGAPRRQTLWLALAHEADTNQVSERAAATLQWAPGRPDQPAGPLLAATIPAARHKITTDRAIIILDDQVIYRSWHDKSGQRDAMVLLPGTPLTLTLAAIALGDSDNWEQVGP